jgi:hypothetical protein
VIPADILARITAYAEAGISHTAIARTLAVDRVPCPIPGETWSRALIEAAISATDARAV